ncbi:MAG: hypothetical protein NUV80_06545 [Candidatus Berkelbacteria bacterium]|nr:hypothetical protein [Candidatus Berkelbacteria bacterium]
MPRWYMVFDQSQLDGLKPVKEGVFSLREGKPDFVFYSEDKAYRHAENLASLKQGKVILIFKAYAAVEADKSPIKRKKFLDSGELVPE